jgi:drug/metabolite transporter (DMT)-like permease
MPAVLALLAAALFGASAPVAKVLVGSTAPLVLAGLLYLGAGAAASLFGFRSRAPLERQDWKYLAGVIGFGGVIGPVLLMVGLQRTAASTSSLLLNLETVFTTLIAIALFGERLGVRAIAALAALVSGAALLTFEPGGATRSWLGPLAVAGACAAWGVDNNLTQKLSARDPLVVVRWKGLAAGAISLALGLATGGHLPPRNPLLAALAVGALGYGLSLALYVRALRSLGAARTAMLFATAPFAGALIAIPLLHERPSLLLAGAGAIMALGVALLVTDPAKK